MWRSSPRSRSKLSLESVMTDSVPIRVMCVDDHPLFLEGISTVISHQTDMRLVGSASSGSEALQQFESIQPTITLMDVRLPDMSGIAVTSEIIRRFPQARIAMLTTSEGDVEIQRALAAGA